mmetsp:Transcript_20179/g.31740  ORF Transcript_20179/g.31740 Transcript_20179/m.31740 type:complete len:141 (-) Transcript_20179:56-478(-)
MTTFLSDVEIGPRHDHPVKSGVVHIPSTSSELPRLHFWSSDLSAFAANTLSFQQLGYGDITTTIFENRDIWTSKYGTVAPLRPQTSTTQQTCHLLLPLSLPRNSSHRVLGQRGGFQFHPAACFVLRTDGQLSHSYLSYLW